MLNTHKLISALKDELVKPLPGLDVQMEMVPITRQSEMLKVKHANPPKESAVMILLFYQESKLQIAFIKRTSYNGVHSAQIAFPGGKYEDNDDTLTETALRETHEEIGIQKSEISILGKLTELFIPPSNFNVLPIIGFIKNRPQFIIDKKEVDKVFVVALDELINSETIQYKKIETRNKLKIAVPCYFINNEIIWGATAMIISEFLEVIKKIS